MIIVVVVVGSVVFLYHSLLFIFKSCMLFFRGLENVCFAGVVLFREGANGRNHKRKKQVNNV
jgi:hypothetical protein